MDAARAVTATFVLNTYPLTVTKSGNGNGVVASAPSGIDCGHDCDEVYPYGTAMTLLGMANTGSYFVEWTGACTGGNPVCQVTMDAAKEATATFVLITYPLTVTKSGTGSGVVASTPAGINCSADCEETYVHGTVVTLTATADTGSHLRGLAPAPARAASPVCPVTMDAAKATTATFVLNTYPLTVTKSGNGKRCGHQRARRHRLRRRLCGDLWPRHDDYAYGGGDRLAPPSWQLARRLRRHVVRSAT